MIWRIAIVLCYLAVAHCKTIGMITEKNLPSSSLVIADENTTVEAIKKEIPAVVPASSTLSTVPVVPSQDSRQIRYRRIGKSYSAEFLGCAVTKDVSCFLEVGAKWFADRRREVLAQADDEVFRAMGRVEESAKPSALMRVISKLFSDLSEMFRDGMSGFFKSARDDDGSENALEGNATSSDESRKRAAGDDNLGVEARKKKDGKIKRLVKLIKLIILGAVIAVKICIAVKIFTAALQFKFFLIALGGLVLNAARFWVDLKKGHNPQKVIYYEHAQHQHHYEGGEEDWEHGGGGGGGYWGRSYDENENGKSGQNLAYAKQAPAGAQYARVEKEDLSWLD